jgi:proteasome accessory factor A
LVGLETEYALRFHPACSFARVPTRFQLYSGLIQSLRSRLPVVRAKHFKEGVFTGNGGAVWFETERTAAGGGLIEGATPECRGPHQVLTYQRAQDRLLAESGLQAVPGGRLTLLKNCRDGRDNVYGAQENYEATLASGWRLAVWRVGLVLLVPLVLLTWLGLLATLVGTVLFLVLAGGLYLLIRWLAGPLPRVALALFGRDLVERRETGGPLAPWLELLLIWVARVVTAPLAVALILLAHATAFRELRRRLIPLLVSRPILAGSGLLDANGNFQLAQKAPAINTVCGFGGYLHDRPLFTFGHFLKALSFETLAAPADYVTLFRRRQRLQINLGDSNMADAAELLRVGTTLLVIDAIEAGAIDKVPTVRRPIHALHRICADPSLQAAVRLTDGRNMTALALQRFYLQACQRYVAGHPQPSAEARAVLQLWSDTLDILEREPEALVGVLDWVTKRRLLAVAQDGTWAERKKIDLRYHELADEGYFQLWSRTGKVLRLLDEEDVARATRMPPPDSPATLRARYIREFSGGEEPLTVNWRRVEIGRGRRAKVIRLDRSRRAPDGSENRS